MTVIEIPTPDPRTFDETARPFAEAISPHYAIKKLIGRGGMGVVYLARDRRLDRLVAIKTLPPHLAGDLSVRERFLRETRMAGAMSHPNIVPIHGADEIDGHVFFVMGFVDGESLAAYVRAHGRLEPNVVVSHLRDVASALSHAHRRGTIHRDIKAENILIERATGRAVVTDFGIARLAEAQPLTATGQLLGTVYYVSPEQIAGEPVDARSDLYSLGVVGYFALTGQFPFDGELASAVLVAHVTKPAPSVASLNPAVPPALAAIVDRCLAKRAEDRFANAEELIAALDAASIASAEQEHASREAALVSETRAQAIWARAAELQASTSSHRKMPVDLMRAAASEAGIDARYVDRAMIEPPKSFVAGVPMRVVSQVVVDGELSPRDFDRVLHTIRDATGRMGTTLAGTREIAWRSSGMRRRIDVAIVPENGRTTIRVSRGIHRLAWGSAAATLLVGSGVGGAIGSIVGGLLALPAPSWSVVLKPDSIDAISALVGVTAMLSGFPVWRRVLKHLRRARERKINRLVESIAQKVRESCHPE